MGLNEIELAMIKAMSEPGKQVDAKEIAKAVANAVDSRLREISAEQEKISARLSAIEEKLGIV